MIHIVMYSGGVGSWAAAKRVAAEYGTKDLILLFADTKMEHPDTYRFLRESAKNVGGHLVEIADGRDIWQVFKDNRFLGNSRVDLCSRILKRELSDKWLKDRYTPDEVIAYVGIDWSEGHRYERLYQRKLPYIYKAPLLDPPYLLKQDMHEAASKEGLKKQWLYEQGAAHANCGGGCIKAGQGAFALLLKHSPNTYLMWEHHEKEMQEFLGKPVTILKEVSKTSSDSVPLSLEALRLRIEAKGEVDLFELGGCGCFTDGE